MTKRVVVINDHDDASDSCGPFIPCPGFFCHWVLRQPQVASVVGAFSVDSGEPKDQ